MSLRITTAIKRRIRESPTPWMISICFMVSGRPRTASIASKSKCPPSKTGTGRTLRTPNPMERMPMVLRKVINPCASDSPAIFPIMIGPPSDFTETSPMIIFWIDTKLRQERVIIFWVPR